MELRTLELSTFGRMLRCLAMALLLVATALPACASVRVGTLTTTERVLREDTPPASRVVHLSIAGNEWRSFQILLCSDTPMRITSVEVDDLRGPGGAVIPRSSIRLYREHQLHITKPSYLNKSFREGWYPDALIPFKHPITGKPLSGARFMALPFDLPQNETHGFWVDVYVPANMSSGQYTSKCVVRIAGQTPVVVPVALTVWGFSLPETPSMQTCFGSPCERIKGYHEKLQKLGKIPSLPDGDSVSLQCSQMLAENRFNATPFFSVAPKQQPDGSYLVPADQIAALRMFIDKYHLNLFSVPHPKYWIKDPVADKDKLIAWLSAWDNAIQEISRPDVTFAIYLIDEPNNAEQYRYVRTWGEAIKEAHSSVKVMVTEQPKTQDPTWGNLYGAVDIWCPLFSLYDGLSEAKRLALGEEIWGYTALCQSPDTPLWQTDFPLLNYRVPAWVSWRYRMTGLLYWGGMTYWNIVDDPWNDPLTYKTRYDYNGEGSLLYPARDVGYDGVVTSMRLKAIRDSIQDYEYMAILRRTGKSEAAWKVVYPLANSWSKWEKDPAAYDKARTALARLITSTGQ